MKTPKQLELEIEVARSGADGQPQTYEQLVPHIIKLYGAELEKGNEEIARLREALRDVFAMIDEGLLVRETSKDINADYFKRLTSFAMRLVKAFSVLPESRRSIVTPAVPDER